MIWLHITVNSSYFFFVRILVVEDDPLLGQTLKSCLEAECFSVDLAVTGTQGSFLGRTNDYDLVILDYVLPEKDGRAVCEEIRKSGRTTRILFLTIQAEVQNKVEVLNLGADDYLTKPYSFAELLARVRALLRRPQEMEAEVLMHKYISINLRSQVALREQKEIYLTRKEFALLEYLLRQKGSVVSRAALAEHVWDSELDIFSNTIESHILNLRRKIDRKTSKSLIQTVPGRGYKMA